MCASLARYPFGKLATKIVGNLAEEKNLLVNYIMKNFQGNNLILGVHKGEEVE